MVIAPRFQAPAGAWAPADGPQLFRQLTDAYGYLTKQARPARERARPDGSPHRPRGRRLQPELDVAGAGCTPAAALRLWDSLLLRHGPQPAWYACPQGFCAAPKVCKTFAVSLAGFSAAATPPRDSAAMGALSAYLQPLCGLPSCIAADGAHAPISSWFWDSWASGPSAAHAALPPPMA